MSQRAQPAIELINVTRRFVSPDGKSMTAMKDFNMTVMPGEFVAVVGPTGCGKSTTLNLVTGLVKPSAGQVRVMGNPVQDIHPSIGFAFQTDALFPWKSVIDNVMAGPLYRGIGTEKARDMAHKWLGRVNLSGHEEKYPHQLSGGMRKRVSLAQTFINEPKILLMDEPFSALDVQTRVLMHDELLQLWADSGACVVFVTHDLEEAIALADKVYVLTSSPATVKSVYPVDIPRPRVASEIRFDERFLKISKTIWEDLRTEVLRGASRDEARVTEAA
ncbi:MAG TPA: ABC transporter ATP-binding protein [Usitatibacter sp.]|jgi:NitT/TauT family transport system ATP-binding protein|nr:ABC transporter ATP-binding protein [Usitatibacter sp.]